MATKINVEGSLKSEAAFYSMTVEFRQYLGNDKFSEGLDWVVAEGANWGEISHNAREALVKAGVDHDKAFGWTAFGIKYGQQWDANGKAL